MSVIELHVTCSKECLPCCKITIQFQIPSCPINLESRRENKKNNSHIYSNAKYTFQNLYNVRNNPMEGGDIQIWKGMKRVIELHVTCSRESHPFLISLNTETYLNTIT